MKQPFAPEHFSVQAVQALQQAGQTAARTRALLLSPIHLLYGLLAQPKTDAAGVLAALGHNPAEMLRALKQQVDTRQMVRWQGGQTQNKDTRDPALDRVLAGSLDEARSVGAHFASTRDLLVSLFVHATPEVAEWRATWGVQVDALRQAPVSVYEQSLAELLRQQAAAQAQARPRRLSISPVFLGLLAALAALGLYLYQTPEPAPFVLFAFVTVGWVVSLALHEFGHAWTAYRGGDISVVGRGYLTLNPLKYTHPVLSILMPVIFLLLGGIGLPGGAVYIHVAALRSRSTQSSVAAAGPAANALFALLLALPFLLIGDPAFFAERLYFWAAVALLLFLQLTAIVFNLLPIPGLDGFGILAPWLPASLHRMLAPFYSFGYLLLIFLFWSVDAFNDLFWGVVWSLLVGLQVLPQLVEIGFSLYRFWM
jgi:Zn-dependent protease